MPKETEIIWYRLERANVLLSLLSQTNNRYITCCKLARTSSVGSTVKMDDLPLDKIEEAQKIELQLPQNKKFELEDAKKGKAVEIDLKVLQSSAHLTSSHGSPLISGTISKPEGDKLFDSTYFHRKPDKNNITHFEGEAPPIFLRVTVPTNRLVQIAGGDTAATGFGDVTNLGCPEKPGFIPVEWVDRISWIVDADKYTPEEKQMLETDSGFKDIRQFPTRSELLDGVTFGSEPKLLLNALNRLSDVTWIRNLSDVPGGNVDMKRMRKLATEVVTIDEESKKTDTLDIIIETLEKNIAEYVQKQFEGKDCQLRAVEVERLLSQVKQADLEQRVIDVAYRRAFELLGGSVTTVVSDAEKMELIRDVLNRRGIGQAKSREYMREKAQCAIVDRKIHALGQQSSEIQKELEAFNEGLSERKADEDRLKEEVRTLEEKIRASKDKLTETTERYLKEKRSQQEKLSAEIREDLRIREWHEVELKNPDSEKRLTQLKEEHLKEKRIRDFREVLK